MKRIGLSFDVEDWFTVRNMREIISYENWSKLDQRIEYGMNFILTELKSRNIHATFFVLGWTAEMMPELVTRIQNDGHEIGTHGYSHTPIDLLSPEEFRNDLKKSIEILEEITGKKIEGFRAPSFSVTKNTLWALDTIKDLGLIYDSSIYPIVHPDYGISNFKDEIQKLNNGITEVPMSSARLMGKKVPISGGGYFRLLPYFITRWLLRKTLNDSGHLTMYFHPWEFDPSQPKMNLPILKKFRHYVGLKKNRSKFKKLLDDFNFVPIKNLLDV